MLKSLLTSNSINYIFINSQIINKQGLETNPKNRHKKASIEILAFSYSNYLITISILMTTFSNHYLFCWRLR